jgi:hypothetical protein
MLPLAVFFWVFGWIFYWIGSNKKLSQQRKKENGKELAFSVLMPEEKYAE